MKAANRILYVLCAALFLSAVILSKNLRNERTAHAMTKDKLTFAHMKIVTLEIQSNMDRITIHNLRTGRID